MTVRLTMLFALSSTVVLLLLGYFIAGSLEGHFEEQDMELLTGKLKLAQHALEKVRSTADLDVLRQHLDDSLVGHHGLELVVVAPAGQILFATSGAQFPQSLLNSRVRVDSARPTVWTTEDNRPLRGVSALARTGIKDAQPGIVAVATDISHHEHFMSSFRMTLWSFVVLAALLTGFLGWLAVRRGLAPLQAIRQEAAGITAHRLHSRLSADAVPVELADLVEALNEMLARLEDSFRRLSDFSSDIAHELRTPVTNLLTQTQVTLSKARTSNEYCDVLASNAEEFERLARMIADMLFLAKSDNDLVIPNKEPLNLIDEVKGLFEFYEALAEEKSIVLTCSGSGFVSGDRLMLRRAISNLLSNALRHTPAGGRIVVRVDDTGDSVVKLSVENAGETIPLEHLPRLFDRFYRVDSSRQRLSEGSGLGLSITRSILRAHGGDAFIRSEGGMTVFELKIPV
ncbi:heavy metal sensor histidine kinase [Candidatus Accumulibacter phosphatis]|uniref:heavy metal sensor histidine kinase n=1 Tax=Candidatus Accumulibacter phosphatis TaxID=327160 RepID=UPI001FE3FB03|nr:heavy metal sensor histidine kinase [Candidatus Accumulibacter phosphatis]HRF13862.1 heavy metal sensor histidine kinase [Candidatus Accumulibacter phosphatis]